jgi:ADP-heptose:LPS heptosyltransferase
MLAQVQAKIKRLKEQKAPSKSGSESWVVIQMGETSNSHKHWSYIWEDVQGLLMTPEADL